MMDLRRDSRASEYSRPLSPSKGRGKGTVKRNNFGTPGQTSGGSLLCITSITVMVWSV